MNRNKKRPRAGHRIIYLDTMKKGTIADVLSVQITVNYDDGTFGFLLLSDEEITWRRI